MKLHSVTSQKTIILLFPAVRISGLTVMMCGKANRCNIKLCPPDGDLRNTVTSQSYCASYLRRLLSDYQLTNFCITWYDGSTDRTLHWQPIELKAFSSDMNVQLLDGRLWLPCKTRCSVCSYEILCSEPSGRISNTRTD